MTGGPVPHIPCPVLVIEDDEVALQIYRRVLLENGFEVRTASTAVSGLEQMEAEPPASIVLDLRLPIVDGLECLRRIRGIPQLAHTPVTIVTGDYFIDEHSIGEIDRLGARLRFKPLWDDDLLRIVREDTSRLHSRT